MIQVVRYSALTFGVLYGIVHRRTLQSQFDSNAAHKEVELRQHWLEQAKEAWAKKQANSNGRKFSQFSFFPSVEYSASASCVRLFTHVAPRGLEESETHLLTENVTDRFSLLDFPFILSPPSFPLTSFAQSSPTPMLLDSTSKSSSNHSKSRRPALPNPLHRFPFIST